MGFCWAHQLSPYSWGRLFFGRAQECEEFCFSFRTDARALVGCGEIFVAGKCPSFSSFFFLFFFFFLVALGTLFCIYVFWRRGTRGSHVFDSDWAGGLVSGGNFSVSRIFQGKKGEFL